MKKFLLLLSLLSLLLTSATPYSARLVRLIIINKSGLPVEVKLTGEYEENFYYLRIPAGDRQLPREEVFTIVPDTYAVEPYYIELWDPVYGYSCGSAKKQTLDILHNMRITFVECDRTPTPPSEPSMIKYGAAGRRHRR